MSDLPQTPLKPPPPRAELAVFSAPDQTTHRLDRLQVEAGGRLYEIFRAVPRGAPPAAGRPLLYMLDGNAAFDFLTPALLASAPGLAIAGIGYPTPLRFSPPDRVLDYTPPRDPGDPRPDPERPKRMVGGAALFAERLVGPLRRAAENGIAVDPERRMIFGHSLAGLFVLHTLLTRPGAFARSVAASPSVWWGDEFALRLEAEAQMPAGFGHRLLVTLGDSERRSSPTGPHWDGPAPHTLEMVRRLKARGLDVRCEVLAGLGHAQTFPASLPLALDFARE